MKYHLKFDYKGLYIGQINNIFKYEQKIVEKNFYFDYNNKYEICGFINFNYLQLD